MSVTLVRPNGESLTFDASPNQSWSTSNSITDHPVEEGVTISDHARHQHLQVSITGIVSDSFVGDGGSEGDRITQALRFLNDAGEGAELLELESRHARSGPWLLESWPYDVTHLRNLVFNIALREVRIAKVETRTLPRAEIEDTEPPTKECGQCLLEECPEPEQEKVIEEPELKSALAYIFDFFGRD